MKALLVATLLVGFTAAYRRYDNYKVVQVVPLTDTQLRSLLEFEHETAFKVDFWRRPSRVGVKAVVMIDPDNYGVFTQQLKRAGMWPIVMQQNVQTWIDQEQKDVQSAFGTRFQTGDDPKDFAFDKYHTHQEINDWLDMLATTYPDLTTVSTVGQSKEGRKMKIIKIGWKGSNKKGFWIDAGIHAREWVAPATSVYIINQLITKSNDTFKDLLTDVDFYIFPSANPDGYEYSRNHDRMWRKTRGGPYCKKTFLGTNRCCYGADPNRNWDFKWGYSGTSNDPCSEIYRGPKAFSETECKQMADYMTGLKDVLKAMITLHSYSEDILYPWGYEVHTYPPDVKELKALGDEMADAIEKVHGTRYSVVNSADGLYPASGASDDWSKHLGIKWVYTIELRPGPGDHDGDEIYGFELPAKYILRTADEVWAGIQVLANRVKTGPN